MTKSYLSQEQQLRAEQVFITHKHLKELNLASEQALAYHDKYLAAMEKVMSCLLNNSDTIESVRTHLAEEAPVNTQPTLPMTGRLAAAYSNWRASPELKMMQTELEFLKEVSATGRHAAKKTKNAVQVLEHMAKKCSKVNTPEFEAKVCSTAGKAQEKLLREQQVKNMEMVKVEKAILNDMISLATSWSTKLITRSDALYTAFAGLGHRTVACFSITAPAVPHRVPLPPAGSMPPPSSSAASLVLHRGSAATTYGTPFVQPSALSALYAAVPLDSAVEGATAGVTLEFHPREGEPPTM
ncbi:hypothetical protein, unknown function [Leishmania braziliensis MHOM/BR/75/M2904]|uniref:BAR domain-containing protein n=2 Tax=Leishmania braziliensis TaxID=5660 RepID=A4HJ55_LEIBR|nr:hypothetical protein, unknown function [Leishmania braziliensis MHOM/BR/75/M2904]CAJ2477764.1 unnamed protein product [Leishmania braziliensis]CAM42514.1 hypothetical protein, unknown function [Leishmania braziliensis MHOM/BR/75/M2904]SYZ68274.1 hypothetical_protein [Leishmania braziliensis MHOM/BR/75/M2904]